MSPTANWSYPTAIKFGAGRIKELGDHCRSLGMSRPLLVTDRGLADLPITADTLAILDDAGLTELVDLAEPTCVIMSAILHFADAGSARDVAAVFIRAVTPGSYMIISVGSGNVSEGNNFTSAYTAARIHIHTSAELESFFGDLELVPPGVVPVRCWHGDEPPMSLKPRTATFLAGVGRKP